MAELAMLTDIQRTVHPEEVTRQLHVMVQARESSTQLCYATNCDIHVHVATGSNDVELEQLKTKYKVHFVFRPQHVVSLLHVA